MDKNKEEEMTRREKIKIQRTYYKVLQKCLPALPVIAMILIPGTFILEALSRMERQKGYK